MSHEFQHQFGIVCVPPVKQDICIGHQEHIVLILGTRIQQPAIVFMNFGLPFRLLFLDSFLVLDPVVLERVLQTGQTVRASDLEDTYCHVG